MSVKKSRREPGADPLNYEMNFVSGGDRSTFTKTPANVTKDYFKGPGPQKAMPRAGKGAMKKRKAIAIENECTPPASKKSKAKADATPGSASNAEIAILPTRQKQKRQYKGKTAGARNIPKSYEECDEADRMLLAWRDGHKEWGPIKEEWKRLTGEDTAQSTLPNRYARLKTNLSILNNNDNAILIHAKRELEDSFQSQKWMLVANVLVSKGGTDYTSCPIVLQRLWKRLMTMGGASVPAGIVDKDFEVASVDGDEEHDADEE